MFITQYTPPTANCCDMRLIRKHAAKRGSFWNRCRGLIFKGFLSRKWAGPAPTPFPVILELERGKVVWVCNNEGIDLECHSGVLWVTVGDQRDLILTSGESLTLHKDQRALVHALLDTRFAMRPPTDSPAQPVGWLAGGRPTWCRNASDRQLPPGTSQVR